MWLNGDPRNVVVLHNKVRVNVAVLKGMSSLREKRLDSVFAVLGPDPTKLIVWIAYFFSDMLRMLW